MRLRRAKIPRLQSSNSLKHGNLFASLSNGVVHRVIFTTHHSSNLFRLIRLMQSEIIEMTVIATRTANDAIIRQVSVSRICPARCELHL